MVDYDVVNERDQPVELHLADRVVVVPAFGAASLTEQDVRVPQVQMLIAQRLITARESVPEAPPAAHARRSKPKADSPAEGED